MTPLEALQQTLAGEHAAVYVYRALAGRVSTSGRPGRWPAGWPRRTPLHRGRRDQLSRWSAPRPATRSPRTSATSCPTRAARAAQLRSRCAGDRAALLGRLRDDGRQHRRGPNRQWAIDALTDSAVRQLGFAGAPDSFPGASPSSDRRGTRRPSPPQDVPGTRRVRPTERPPRIGLPASRTAAV